MLEKELNATIIGKYFLSKKFRANRYSNPKISILCLLMVYGKK